jgi:hypothetical protein
MVPLDSVRCRATAPMQAITLLVEEGNGKRRKRSLCLAAFAIEEHVPPAATHRALDVSSTYSNRLFPRPCRASPSRVIIGCL